MRARLLVPLVVVLVMLSTGVQAALAATPSDVQYGNPATVPTSAAGVQGVRTAPLGTAEVGGTLPFTGLDLGLVSVGGVLLLVGGIAARRLGR